ncbi:hypothetical protein ONE63_004404 [Megalurothrips usitatus]|uniref:Complement component 1 Q subcomponent-binding protein, mitochondrial n=1 Tax=Megalurothrips usitatus TaxID=439358 RepID=A0AAV7X983_9NEOP|nr:hypothetical protein ONE63_004404 [Megalurothrips usitatus]
MSSLLKSVMRLAPLKTVASPLRWTLAPTSRAFTRSLGHMCSSLDQSSTSALSGHSGLRLTAPTNLCSCGCGSRQIHSKGERELIEFLAEEIATETKNRKAKSLPSEVEGFKVKTDGADVILTKSTGDEVIEIHFNINHTVDNESEPSIDPSSDKPDFGELKSKPTFDVDIKRGTQTLSFTCSFFESNPEQAEDAINDVFGIDEITLFDGEWDDKHYSVAGEILDGCLYDLLMNLLDEKGVSNDFVEKLSDFATAYENHRYITLLQDIQKFTSKK